MATVERGPLTISNAGLFVDRTPEIKAAGKCDFDGIDAAGCLQPPVIEDKVRLFP